MDIKGRRGRDKKKKKSVEDDIAFRRDATNILAWGMLRWRGARSEVKGSRLTLSSVGQGRSKLSSRAYETFYPHSVFVIVQCWLIPRSTYHGGEYPPRVSHNFVTFRDEQRYMEEINLFEKKKKKRKFKDANWETLRDMSGNRFVPILRIISNSINEFVE